MRQAVPAVIGRVTSKWSERARDAVSRMFNVKGRHGAARVAEWTASQFLATCFPFCETGERVTEAIAQLSNVHDLRHRLELLGETRGVPRHLTHAPGFLSTAVAAAIAAWGPQRVENMRKAEVVRMSAEPSMQRDEVRRALSHPSRPRVRKRDRDAIATPQHTGDDFSSPAGDAFKSGHLASYVAWTQRCIVDPQSRYQWTLDKRIRDTEELQGLLRAVLSCVFAWPRSMHRR